MSDGTTEPVASQTLEMKAAELSRRICHILRSAADRLGVPCDEDFHFEDLARTVVLAAQADRTKLPPSEYRHIWQIWQIFRCHRHGGDGVPTPFSPVFT